KALLAGLVAAPYFWAHQHRLFDIPLDGVAAALGLFLGVEFLYYWMHRAAHRVRWMWATHRVHHSAAKFNLTAAFRLGWTGPISGGPLFFLPLVLLGFPPLAVVGALGLNLAYQFFLHMERPVRLGPLEWVLNTPTHHRLHHAVNDGCLDKNFGGVLIIFDRLFGTFAAPPENDPLRFGLKGAARTDNPLKILFGEWTAMARDAARARSLRAFGRALFGPPS
ncbi:MAG: sterol desaturase family protein, partial [Pseudomonadota bacterium]